MKQRLHAFKLDGEGKRQFWNGKPIKRGDKKVPLGFLPSIYLMKCDLLLNADVQADPSAISRNSTGMRAMYFRVYLVDLVSSDSLVIQPRVGDRSN